MVLLLVCLLLAAPAWAVDTYVALGGNNSNACGAGIGSPKASIVNAINSCGAAGNRVIIRGGTYDEYLDSFGGTTWPSGTSFSNPFTLMAAPGESVTIKPSDTSGGHYLLVIFSASPAAPKEYIVLDRLTLDDTLRNFPVILKFDQNANHIRFQNGKIVGGLVSTSGNGVIAVQGIGEFNEILHSEITGAGGYAFYVGNGYRIDGNYLHDIGGYVVHQYNQGHTDQNNSVISNNRIENSGTHPEINLTQSCAILLSSGTNNAAYNNIVVNHNGCGVQVYQSSFQGKVYNNTIYGNRDACIDINPGASQTDARNNICYGNGSNIPDAGTSSTTSPNTLNSQNPLFFDPPNGDFRLHAGSPALDTGVSLVGTFTTDVNGNTRVAPWDQGAIDMAASSLLPEKGTFFISPTGTNIADCHAATGTVAVPSTAPFGSYDIARQCMAAESTLYFRAGLYPPLDTTVTPFRGGTSWSGPTTLAAYPGEAATVRATTGTVVVNLANPTTDHFLILSGLHIDGNNVTGTLGVLLGGVNDIRLESVEVLRTYYDAVYPTGAANIEIRSSTLRDTVAGGPGNLLGPYNTTNVTLTGSTLLGSANHGIVSYGGNSGLLVETTTIRNSGGKGIVLGNDTAPRVQNTLIYTNTHGIHLQAGVTGAGLYYNTLWNNSSACMLFDTGVSVSQATNNVCWQVATLTNNAGSGMVLTTNQTTDPLFASVTPGDVNFLHLCGAVGVPAAGCTGKSSAIDTGTPLPSLMSDYARKARPDGVQVDRGAFEEVPVPVPPAQVGLAPVYRTTHFLTLLP